MNHAYFQVGVEKIGSNASLVDLKNNADSENLEIDATLLSRESLHETTS